MTIPQLPADAEAEYYAKISKIESDDNPRAKAKTSSASGRFQFIKSTWEGLGYDWANVFNDKLQYEAIEKFTRQNANALVKAGCAVNHATLYGSHFLGTAGFLRVMRGLPDASIATVTSEAQRKANPSILKGTIRDFTDWLKRKTGDDYTKRYAESGIVQPADPIVLEPLEQNKVDRNWNVGLLAIILIAVVVVGAYFIFVRR